MSSAADKLWNTVLFTLRRTRRVLLRLAGRGGDGDFSVAEYWEERYHQGNTSGSGSYGRLADWKAKILNEFVHRHGITRILELGCGDGNQLSLAAYPQYLGFDISATAVKICTERFKDRDWAFHVYAPGAARQIGREFRPQLVMSLDVIFHLVEDKIYEDYMQTLFSMDPDFIVIYSSNGNFTVGNRHIRNWMFTDWIAQNAPEWKQVDKIDNPYPWDAASPDETSFADFYVFRKAVTTAEQTLQE